MALPLPRSPHYENRNATLFETEPSEIYRGWPPRGTGATPGKSHAFLSERPDGGPLKVVWPPSLASSEDLEAQQLPAHDGYDASGPNTGNLGGPQNQQNAGGPNMTMTYPSAFKLRDEAPIDPQTAPMGTVPSQPAFKTVVPGRKRGDDVWPPKGAFQDGSTTTGDDAMKPTRIEKDYDEFFLRNALPSNYPGYQIPPGTQHVGFLDEAQPL